MATSKKSTAKKTVQSKSTAERPSDVKPVNDGAKQPCAPEPQLDRPLTEEELAQQSAFVNESMQVLEDLFFKAQKNGELSKILRILDESPVYETRQILEDVRIKITRRVEDNLREQERILEQLRRDSQLY